MAEELVLESSITEMAKVWKFLNVRISAPYVLPITAIGFGLGVRQQ